MKNIDISILRGKDAPEVFSKSLISAKKTTPHGYHLLSRPAEDFCKEETTLLGILSEENPLQLIAGVAVIDGFITSLFKNQVLARQENIANVMPALIGCAIQSGGTKVGCFGQKLTEAYLSMGFIPVSLSPVPESWTKTSENFVAHFVRPDDAQFHFDGLKNCEGKSQLLNSTPFFSQLDTAFEFMNFVDGVCQQNGLSNQQLIDCAESGVLQNWAEQFSLKEYTECEQTNL